MMILYIKLQLNEFRKPSGTRRRIQSQKRKRKNIIKKIKVKEKINKNPH